MKKKIYIFLIILILVLVFVGVCLNPKEYYTVESRVDNIGNSKVQPAIGWLRVQGTDIDYPVIYNDIDVDLKKVDDSFLWTNENSKKLGNREIILGHNILNISKQPLITNENHTRFEQLLSFIYYDFAKTNKYVQYTIGTTDHLYKIFAVRLDEDTVYHDKNLSKKELKEYITQLKKDSIYNYDIDVNENDKIITLSTCTRFYGIERRVTFKVDARLVRKNERIDDYRVETNEKYDKLESEMKGDVENGKV